MVGLLTAILLIFALKSLPDLLFYAARIGLAAAFSFPQICPDAVFLMAPVALPIVSIALSWATFHSEQLALRDSLSRSLASV